ncbi:MAG: hypothetical protein KKD77_23100, partial [Gammaproteobacteria bacterium]|nr:hypothetical protein [Gammaproteobacteria bacterium]
GRWYRCTGAGTVDTTDINDLGVMGGSGDATFEAFPGERLIGTEYFAFNRILDVKDVALVSARIKEIHSWAQYKCRQAADINDDINGDAWGTVNGNIALAFTTFVGDMLHTARGVFIDGYNANDTPNITFWDIEVDTGGVNVTTLYPLSSVDHQFPFISYGNINFSSNFTDEVDATTRFTMYFQYITSTACTGVKISGSAGASAVIDYTGDAGKLDHLLTNDYLRITGFTTESGNNGLWKCTGDPSTNTIAADKVDGVNPTDEAIGDACTVLENPFESPGAIIVDDETDTDIDAEIDASSIPFSFKYTTNVQGGRTADSNAEVIVVALAYDGAQYTIVNHTITKTTGQTITVNGIDELNYEDVV